MSPEMQDTYSTVCSAIEKKYGKGAIQKLTTNVKPNPDDAISSGSIGLDTALGIGGYKKGRIVEVYGPEAGGKTTLCLHAAASTQRLGKLVAFIDAEHALDPKYASDGIGVDLNRMLISQPDYGEQALDIANMLAKSGEIGLIIIDSVAALVPKAELEGEMEDNHVGLQARMMGQALRMITGSCSQTGTTIIFVNQLRMKIGVIYGSPEVTAGGRALPFYASQRLDIRRTGNIKKGEDISGCKTRVKVVKNKLAPPFKIAEFDITFGKGIDINGETLDLGVEDGIIEKSGAWYSYNGARVGQGRENSKSWLNENPEIREKIRQEILSNRGLGEQ